MTGGDFTDRIVEQTVLQGQLSHDLLQSRCLTAKLLTSSEVAARAVLPAGRFLPASRNSFDHR